MKKSTLFSIIGFFLGLFIFHFGWGYSDFSRTLVDDFPIWFAASIVGAFMGFVVGHSLDGTTK